MKAQQGAAVRVGDGRGAMSIWKKTVLTLAVIGLGLTLGFCTARSTGPVIPDASPGQATRQPLPSHGNTARPPSATGSPTVRPQVPGQPVSEVLVDSGGPIEPDTLIPPWEEPYHPFLNDEPNDVSISVGDVSNGYLINARLLPLPGKTYDILPRQKARGLAWGSDEMIDLLQHTAKQLWRRGRRRLWLGNIGRRGGGDIPYSVSHNSGRDADIAFCYTNPKGYPVNPPDLVPLDKEGVSTSHGGYYRFDTARTWMVIQALITHRNTQVQYLFLSNPLKKKLLEHARKKGIPAGIIKKAERLMGQPGYALPHNDHIHVRIYCSKKDILGGCVNSGNIHGGTRLWRQELAERIEQVTAKLKDPEAEIRARAIERLALFKLRDRVDAMAELLDDPSARVRRAASLAVGELGNQRHVTPMIAAFEIDPEPSVQMDMLESLRLLGGPKAGAFMARVLAEASFEGRQSGPLPKDVLRAHTVPTPPPPKDGEPPLDEVALAMKLAMGPVETSLFTGHVLPLSDRRLSVRLAAIEVAADSERPEPVRPLIDLLTHPDPLIRGRAARALRRLPNHSTDIDWSNPAALPDTLEAGQARWLAWYRRMGRQSRDTWIAAGFRAAGYNVPKLDKRHIWEIVRAIPDDNHLSYNSQRTLMRLSKHWPLSLTWPKTDAAWHWTRWFKRRRAKFRITPPPASLSPYNK